jgi:class I fructose-bisphosphate aldolase
MSKISTATQGKNTPAVEKILSNYEGDSSQTKANIERMLNTGRLAGTGKMVILPVDQGFEHGPARSFASNPAAYDPHYHFQLAIDAGLNAYAAPLGMLEAGVDTFKGKLPLILKVNSSNSLMPKSEAPHQAITSSVADAVRLGCAAIGLTIYPGGDYSLDMFEEAAELAREAKAAGLAVVIWSYPRGAALSKDGETAIDVTAYAAHIAALLGAHIIKVKPPTAHIEQDEARKVYESKKIPVATLAERIAHIKQCCFNGRRIVIFSGGAAKSEAEIIDEVSQINQGGGFGSIMGRNAFQRPREEALSLLDKVVGVYLK